MRLLFAGLTTSLTAVSSKLLDLSILGVITALNIPITVIMTKLVLKVDQTNITWVCCISSVIGVIICINPFGYHGGMIKLK